MTGPGSQRMVSVSLTVVRPSREERCDEGQNCPRCESVMDVHQPDIDNPERFLGTCPECSLWVVIESIGRSRVLLLELPDNISTAGALAGATPKYQAV